MSLLYNSQAQSVVILLRVLLSILAPWYPAQKHSEANMRGRGTVRRSLSERFGEEAHAVSNVLIKSAVGLLRTPVANAVVPVGWPPLRDIFARTIELGVSIHV